MDFKNNTSMNIEQPPPADTVLEDLRALATNETGSLPSTTLFVQLKGLNRAANTAARAHKAAAASARSEMDKTQFELQNLLYEKRHLEREIEKCRQFASVYQDIPLYSLDEFSSHAPVQMRSEQAMADEHQLMLNRLNLELLERQKLEARRKQLSKQKDELIKQGKAKQATADSVAKYLDALMKTATDTQKKVDELVPALPEPELEPVVVAADVSMEA